MNAAATARVLKDVLLERGAQDDKWGEQNHPDGTGPDGSPLWLTGLNLDLRTGAELARIFRNKCQSNTPESDNWFHILLEEVFEAGAESEPAKLRAELVQSAAVLVAWIEAIDRRTS